MRWLFNLTAQHVIIYKIIVQTSSSQKNRCNYISPMAKNPYQKNVLAPMDG